MKYQKLKGNSFSKALCIYVHDQKTHMFWIETKTLVVVYGKMLHIPKPQWRTPNLAILLVTFLGWLSDPLTG